MLMSGAHNRADAFVAWARDAVPHRTRPHLLSGSDSEMLTRDGAVDDDPQGGGLQLARRGGRGPGPLPRGKREEAAARLPDDLVEAATLCGPRSYVAERIGRFRAAGVRDPQRQTGG
jgi:hypothetical protein